MTTTEISQTDSATGALIDVNPDLRARVEDAARLLEGEIGDLNPVSVNARWQYVVYPQTGLTIQLHLNYGDGAVMIQIPPRTFFDFEKLRARLREAASDLRFLILGANRKALRDQLDRLSLLDPVRV